jgi:hypothetical protein
MIGQHQPGKTGVLVSPDHLFRGAMGAFAAKVLVTVGLITIKHCVHLLL